jgi:tetratricopeptide (TPR) repeat protein
VISLPRIGDHDDRTERSRWPECAFEEARSKGLENPDMLAELYEIAFHRRNVAAMEQYIARATGHPLERRLTAIRAQSLAALGQWRASEQLSDRIIQGHPEVQLNETVNDAIREMVNVALRSALAGKSGDRWLRSVNATVPRIVVSDAENVLAVASVALALTGDGAGAIRLRDRLAQQYPSSTIVRKKWMPAIGAATAIRKGDFDAAINSLAHMEPFEFGREIRGVDRHAVFVPTYLRAQAYLASEQPRAAAVEFKKILDRHALGLTSPILPLSRLGLARAYANAGDFAASLQTYDEVLAHWKDADPDYVPLVEARRESSELRKIDKVRRTSER